MKRFVSIILAALLLISLCGCGTNTQDKFNDPVNFYFLRDKTETVKHSDETSVLVPLIREGDGIRSNLLLLLNRYLSDPGAEGFRSPFPRGTSVISVRNDENLVEITLTDSIAEYSGLDLTLACACLSYTIMELTGTQGVRICAENKTLDGHSSITMDQAHLVMIDLAANPSESVK